MALLLRPAADTAPTAHAIGLAVLAALRSCLDDGPVLLAIDDIEWLDAGSLEALRFALRRIIGGPLSLLLAGALRGARPTRSPLPTRRCRKAGASCGRAARGFADHARAAERGAGPDPAAADRDARPGPAGGPQVAREPVLGAGEIWARMESAESAVPPLARARWPSASNAR